MRSSKGVSVGVVYLCKWGDKEGHYQKGFMSNPVRSRLQDEFHLNAEADAITTRNIDKTGSCDLNKIQIWQR